MASRQETVIAILERLTINTGPDITGAVAGGMDGIVLVSQMSSEVNVDRVGAVAATMIGVTKRVANELRIGIIEEAIIKADRGLFLVLPAGEKSLLAVNVRRGANLGMIRIEAREAAASIGQAL